MSKVSFEQFSQEFAKELEIEGTEFLTCPLGDLKEFDSMGKIEASLVIEQLFNFEIDLELLDKVVDLKSLYTYCINFQS